MGRTGEGGAGVRVRLWDGPTRLVHWLLVVLIPFSWGAAEWDNMVAHRVSGYVILGLLLFRLYWGFAGPTSARFASFVKGPAATLAYARKLFDRHAKDVPGHNPLGALSVLAIVAALIVQVVSGLFAVDVDGLESGPLSDRVDFDAGRAFAKVHQLSFTAIQVLVLLHLAAIVFYLLYRRNNLVGPMITGRRTVSQDPGLRFAPWWRLVLGVLAAAAVSWAISKGLRVGF